MDGRQGMISNSLQFKLSVWLVIVVGGMALAVGAYSLGAAFNEANDFQDNQLRLIATMVQRQQVIPAPQVVPEGASDVDPESQVLVQLLDRPGKPPVNVSSAAVAFRTDLEEGVHTVSVKQQDWRVVVGALASGTRFVVAQRTSTHAQIVLDKALRAVLPFFVLIPLLLLLLRALIPTMLRPVKALAAEMDQREQDNFRAISVADIPTEIRPFVVAVNRLQSRMGLAMSGQRRFLVSAAKELRTLMNSLSLDADQLGGAEMSAPARQRLNVLQGGLQRLRQMLDQLLTSAPAQESPNQQLRPVYVRTVLMRVAESLMPLAHAKDIDMGMLGEQDYTVSATEGDIFTLAKSLVDNAIRHTPSGGKIDLSVRKLQGRTVLVISNTGPGIPDDERKRVFDPFYCSPGNEVIGSGLGLSTALAIAQRIGAHIHLDHANPSEMTGLRVMVSF